MSLRHFFKLYRHVNDWEFRYDLLDMLLQEGGDPNVEGRDGSLPLMVCLVPLVNRDHLHHFTHTMKVCYLNCVRILLKYGANPNCSSRSNLTPLHVLNFAGKIQYGLFLYKKIIGLLFQPLKTFPWQETKTRPKVLNSSENCWFYSSTIISIPTFDSVRDLITFFWVCWTW